MHLIVDIQNLEHIKWTTKSMESLAEKFVILIAIYDIELVAFIP